MFNNDITLNPTTYGGANTNEVYSLVGWGGDSSSIRRVSTTASTTPTTLRVEHREAEKAKIITDQHLVRLDKQFTDPVMGKVILSSWMVIHVPRGTTVITLQEIKDQIGRLIAFEQAVGALDKILNSEP